MEAASGSRVGRKRVTLLASVGAVAALAAAGVALVVWLNGRDDVPAAFRPDVELGAGSHAGRDWIYGYDVDVASFDGPCFKLVIDRQPAGCGTKTAPFDGMAYLTGSGGDPEGLLTAEFLVSDEVARVSCGTGADSVGETHLFEMPAGDVRPVLCLATESEVAGREWFAFAFDGRGRQIAKSDGLPQH